MEYISILENCLGCKAIIDYLPMQLGDSPATQADTSKLKSKIATFPTPIEVGIDNLFNGICIINPFSAVVMSINYSAFLDLKISFVSLGYVGLPLLIAFSKAASQNDLNWDIVGFDIDQTRIAELCSNFDKTFEVSDSDLFDLSFTKFTCLDVISRIPIFLL